VPNAGPTETRLAHEAGRQAGTPPKLLASAAEVTAHPDGTVRGVPRRWLRLEGAVLLAGSLIAYAATGEPWWLVPLALLVPDLFMAGYLRGTRRGAQLYNIAHSTALPAGMVGLGWWQSQPLVLALGLIWLTHMGMDRLLGYGLKYDDHFQHTHLGIQAPRDGSHAREGALAAAGLPALIEHRDGLVEIPPRPG
jgi:hypothetical protein